MTTNNNNFNIKEFIARTVRNFLNGKFSEPQEVLVEYVDSNLIKIEFERVIKEAVPKIEEAIKVYKDCKIGKSGNIENRFDTSYRDQNYIDLIKISNCKYMEAMSMIETHLIKHFGDLVMNDTDVEVGNKTYSGDYWIYVVHKGIRPNDEEKTK